MDIEVNDTLDAPDQQDDSMIIGGEIITIGTSEDPFASTSKNPFENQQDFNVENLVIDHIADYSSSEDEEHDKKKSQEDQKIVRSQESPKVISLAPSSVSKDFDCQPHWHNVVKEATIVTIYLSQEEKDAELRKDEKPRQNQMDMQPSQTSIEQRT